MISRYVVDTNVLIAASACDEAAQIAKDATPNDPKLRKKIWEWLTNFEASEERLVLDTKGEIEKEYHKKLGFNDYGQQVIIQKYSTAAVDIVDITFDRDDNAILEDHLMRIVTDCSDRKMVAAALRAQNDFGDPCIIANASDTDWYDWEDALSSEGLRIEQIIPEWSRPKWEEKRNR